MTSTRLERSDLTWIAWTILAVLGVVWLGYLLLTTPYPGAPSYEYACNSVFTASDKQELPDTRNDKAYWRSRCNAWRIERLAWSFPATLLTALFGSLAMLGRFRAQSNA